MKKLLIVFSLLLFVFTFSPLKANSEKIVDHASVFSDADKSILNQLVNNYIEKTGFDMVIYFDSANPNYKENDPNSITKIADDYFDYNGYGLGNDHQGIIIFVDIYYRDYTITTCGSQCISTYTDQALEDMYHSISQYFSQNNWYEGAKTFINKASQVYDNYQYYHPTVNYGLQAVKPALIGALIITIIAFIILWRQLKHTGIKTNASAYMTNSNINIFRSGEIYLYTTYHRTRIERHEHSSSSPSHSSTHSSSSGRNHGGGGSHRF